MSDPPRAAAPEATPAAPVDAAGGAAVPVVVDPSGGAAVPVAVDPSGGAAVPVAVDLSGGAGRSGSFGADEVEDEPAWAALLSYETYQQVARRVLRAGTQVARTGYRRHDAAVVAIALVLIVAGGVAHRRLLTPPPERFEAHGLQLRRASLWLPPEPVPPAASRLARDAPPPAPPVDGALPYHVAYTSAADADVRMEVRIAPRPAWSNLLTGLELERRDQHGALYASDGGATRSIAGHDWLRTTYQYAYAAQLGDAPRLGRAVEYATVDRERLYAVTFHGTTAQTDALEREIAPTLRVASKTGVPLLPRNRLAEVRAPAPVQRAMTSTVMVVVADVQDGRLRPAGGGSGMVVSADGSILTNFHVVHDRDGRLHDVFVIGTFAGPGRAPALLCAGRPRRGKLQPELDLALLKCDLDLDGRRWDPARAAPWRPVPAPTTDVGLGDRLWVLGYPDVGGGGLTLSQGLVDGWTGEQDSLARDFLKTDASITHGNSGGPVVDDAGRVVGIASAFRLRVTTDGKTVETSKVGLVRPWSVAGDLLAIARAGWTPRDGMTSVELEPTAADVPAEGVLLDTRLVDAANGRPVPGALLMVLRPGLPVAQVDMNRLDDQVIAWGRASADGEVRLRQPVPAPGTYGVLVLARGYEPLLGERALEVPADAPAAWRPWDQLELVARP